MPARVGDARRRRTSGWAIAALTALGGAGRRRVGRRAHRALQQPDQATVPDLVGKTSTEAESLIRAANLSPAGRPSTDATARSNNVESQDVEANSRVDAGQSVDYMFCGGQRQITVPTVVGLNQADRGEAAHGCSASNPSRRMSTATSPRARSSSTDPAGGTKVPEQTPVKLQISKGNLKVVPDVRQGRTQDTASGVLESAGFENCRGRAADRPRIRTNANKVLTQDPAARPGPRLTHATGSELFVGQYEPPPRPDGPATTESPGLRQVASSARSGCG